MGVRRFLALVALVSFVAVPGTAHAQGDITLSIAKHARLTGEGAVIVSVDITCEPLPGTEEFQEAFAGAGQAKTGAEGEGGVDGMIVCDGVTRTHTARVSPNDALFNRGPAGAGVSVIICNNVGDDQVCATGATGRRIVISGRQAT